MIAFILPRSPGKIMTAPHEPGTKSLYESFASGQTLRNRRAMLAARPPPVRVLGPGLLEPVRVLGLPVPVR